MGSRYQQVACYVAPTPQQQNQVDCGLFVLKNIQHTLFWCPETLSEEQGKALCKSRDGLSQVRALPTPSSCRGAGFQNGRNVLSPNTRPSAPLGPLGFDQRERSELPQ